VFASYPCLGGKGDHFSHLQYTQCSAAFANAKMLKMAMFGDFFPQAIVNGPIQTVQNFEEAINTETKPMYLK
jgi:hypothetical protein